MDVGTIITALCSSGLFSLGAARWLTTHFIDQRLAKDLKSYQATLDAKLVDAKGEVDLQLTTVKAELEASLRRSVDEYLGDRAAERQYRFDAQKRLYAAIGPLRFQLVVACAEFVGRVIRIGSGKQPYSTSLKGYFGRSTAFRLLRLVAITELIERQIAYADFSVDPSTSELLSFKKTVYRCLSSSTVSLDHPKANWDHQVEHVFWDELSMIAAAMIIDDRAGISARVMRFDEFTDTVTSDITCDKMLAAIKPIPRFLEDFTIASKPILWVRFVTLAQLCNSLVERDGSALGIVAEPYDGAGILRASTDPFVKENYDRYCDVLKDIVAAIVTSPQAKGSAPSGGNLGAAPLGKMKAM
jgi:hypothetical protein